MHRKLLLNPWHRTASIAVSGEETRDRNYATMSRSKRSSVTERIQRLTEPSRWLSNKKAANMPVCEDTIVRVLTYSECNSFVVEKGIVPEEDALRDYTSVILACDRKLSNISASPDKYPTPNLDLKKVEFHVYKKLYLLPRRQKCRSSARCGSSYPYMTHKTEGHTISQKMAKKVDMALLNREKLEEPQESDSTD